MMLKVLRTRSKFHGATIFFFASVVVLTFGGCASIKSTPEDTVRERAKQRWVALMSGDTQRAYDLTTPSFRSVSSFNSYKAKFGNAVNLLATEVVSVSCETEKCTAVVRVDARPLLGGGFGNTLTTHVDETWLLEDGLWWFFQKL